jgi:hypothetical protein
MDSLYSTLEYDGLRSTIQSPDGSHYCTTAFSHFQELKTLTQSLYAAISPSVHGMYPYVSFRDTPSKNRVLF